MDAMVTARMPQGKKEAGVEVLRSLGTTSSTVINELFDYLIARRELPFGTNAASSPLLIASMMFRCSTGMFS